MRGHHSSQAAHEAQNQRPNDDADAPPADLADPAPAAALVADVAHKRLVRRARQVLHEAGVVDGPGAVKVARALGHAAAHGDVGAAVRVHVRDDGADQRGVRQGRGRGRGREGERDRGAHAVQRDGEVEN